MFMPKAIKALAAIALLIVVAILLAGCGVPESEAQKSGQKLTEKAFEQQQGAVPYPVDELKDSLERRNLVERLRRTNKPNALSYLYVLSYGKVLGYYTVKGKVSSTQSQMTASDLVAKFCSGCNHHVVTAPGDDGSYGPNESGIFFFTTEGVMVTTNLEYMVSDQPLPFDVPELAS